MDRGEQTGAEVVEVDAGLFWDDHHGPSWATSLDILPRDSSAFSFLEEPQIDRRPSTLLTLASPPSLCPAGKLA